MNKDDVYISINNDELFILKKHTKIDIIQNLTFFYTSYI